MNEHAESVSIVIPVFNEEWSIFPLFGKLRNVMEKLNANWEIVFVNDGSTDNTRGKLEELVQQSLEIKVINLRRNCGLTQALQVGFDHASGANIVTISGNMQNDPADIPRFLAVLEEGFDICVGWRSNLNGKLRRSGPQRFINSVVSRIAGTYIHDYGCTMCAFRGRYVRDLRLYGALERYIPIFASWRGGKITEIEVNQYPRSHGHGKQKNRARLTLRTILDLIFLAFLERYSDRPLYIFGSLGIISMGCSFFIFLSMIYLKYSADKSFTETPLPLVVALFFLVGMMLIVLGVITEFITRIYHAGSGHKLYEIDNMLGFDNNH